MPRSTCSRRSAWSAWGSARARGQSAWSTPSLDRERAGHAAGLVAVHRAVVLVLPGLQVHGHLRRLALADRVGLLLDPLALDLDSVREGGRVVEDDRGLPGLGGERALVELQRAAGVGTQLQRLCRAAATAAVASAVVTALRFRGLVAARAAAVGTVVVSAACAHEGEGHEQADDREDAHGPVYADRAEE